MIPRLQEALDSVRATGGLGIVLAANGILIWFVFFRLRRLGLALLQSLPERRPEKYTTGDLPELPSIVTAEGALQRYRREIETLRVLTLVAPLLGLLGTVMGLGLSFSAGEDRTQVVSGVAQALVSTQMGLAIAFPGFFGHARLVSLRKQIQVRLQILKTSVALFESTQPIPGP